ncbi:hypothetical protein PHYSODRAFT_255172 [Phytophthora sojae]|uniref:Uncharacterized protein n=1 Tax=Phytophthora sojae (strain P6497) TaxID=1094619 RepID=G4ZQ88_PHYSP|nr:hypothetical protein PHYSODRAFT_255172 [Phytophthora sojae]EGZ14799.1 hypothetical protein PHYSODRAFT_255172 [Phytophthora sojae]|eukprot:XP_009528548.1 hypothetical protein PHYSODRAFT_255172 [Phytophthora sojae]
MTTAVSNEESRSVIHTERASNETAKQPPSTEERPSGGSSGQQSTNDGAGDGSEREAVTVDGGGTYQVTKDPVVPNDGDEARVQHELRTVVPEVATPEVSAVARQPTKGHTRREEEASSVARPLRLGTGKHGGKRVTFAVPLKHDDGRDDGRLDGDDAVARSEGRSESADEAAMNVVSANDAAQASVTANSEPRELTVMTTADGASASGGKTTTRARRPRTDTMTTAKSPIMGT